MANLVFDPSSKELELALGSLFQQTLEVLRQELPKLGVKYDDIIVRFLHCKTAYSSEEHVEVVLKTDNPRVTATEVVRILTPVFDVIRFEVSRIFVGNSGDWDSNY